MATKGVKRVEIAGGKTAATFAAMLSGDFLPVQVLCGGKREKVPLKSTSFLRPLIYAALEKKCHSKHKFPEASDICCT